MVYKLVLIRHGESIWNARGLFTGWVDVKLSPAGLSEAAAAGVLLRDAGITFHSTFTSVLKRSIQTSNIILEEMGVEWLPTVRDWRLNERHYGALQGLNKVDTVEKHGEAQVKIWRRAFSIPPPPLEVASADDVRKYAILGVASDLIPRSESLADCSARVQLCWKELVEPALRRGDVLVTAHGNSLRALCMMLDNLTEDEVAELNIPTASPLVYEFEEGTMRVLRHYYLGDAAAVAARAAAVAAQGSAGAKKE